jgi:polyhydroxybutyrate depolymerase
MPSTARLLLIGLLGLQLLPAVDPVIAGVTIAPGTSATVALVHGGRSRTVLVHIPSGYVSGTALPLVAVLHGGAGTPEGIAATSAWDAKADAVGACVLYPAGLALDASGVDQPATEDRYWANDRNTRPDQFGVDDVGFIGAAVDLVAASIAIDRQRVYAMGMSNGGSMVHILGRDDATRWTALASVCGSMSANPTSSFAPARPVAFLQIHGDADSIMPYAGGTTPGQGGAVLSATASVEQWRQAIQAEATATVTALPNTAPLDGCTASRSLWANGTAGTVVALVTIANGSHSWPGSPPGSGAGAGNKTQDFSATDLAWTFFETWHRPNLAPVITMLPSAGPGTIVLP